MLNPILSPDDFFSDLESKESKGNGAQWRKNDNDYSFRFVEFFRWWGGQICDDEPPCFMIDFSAREKYLFFRSFFFIFWRRMQMAQLLQKSITLRTCTICTALFYECKVCTNPTFKTTKPSFLAVSCRISLLQAKARFTMMYHPVSRIESC